MMRWFAHPSARFLSESMMVWEGNAEIETSAQLSENGGWVPTIFDAMTQIIGV